MTGPFDAAGRFGPYGGAYVPETLVAPLQELTAAWSEALADPNFGAQLHDMLSTWAGRPTPLTRAERLGASIGSAEVWLKREDLNHTGAHKLNNALGQALLARRMGKTPAHHGQQFVLARGLQAQSHCRGGDGGLQVVAEQAAVHGRNEALVHGVPGRLDHQH